MKVRDLINSSEVINTIMTKKLPIKVGFIIANNVKKFESTLQNFEEKRIELLKSYGEKDENGELVVNEDNGVKVINPEEFAKEIDVLLDTEVSFVLDTLTFDDLALCDSDKYDSLTPNEINALKCMIAEENIDG